MKHKFQVGDYVRIKADYWEKLSNSITAIKRYVDNGPNYVYTILRKDTNGEVVISDYGDFWSDPDRYLEPVSPEEDEEDLPCQTLEGIL